MPFKIAIAPLTEQERDALEYALSLAYGDQETYLKTCPDIDYGDEWPEAAAFKAQNFRAIGKLADRLGIHERDRWDALAVFVEGLA